MALATRPQDPLAAVKAFVTEKPKQLELQLDRWVEKQPAWVEGAVAGVKGSFQGAFLGVVMGYMGKMNLDAAASSGAAMPPPMMKMGGPGLQARNFAVMTGVNAGVAAFMKRVRGKEDIQNSLAAAFCSGASFSLISGGMSASGMAPPPGAPTPNPLMAAFSAGVVFALFQGGFYKLGEMFGGGGAGGSKEQQQQQYLRVKAMLQSLNLPQYEKNVRKGLLTDDTIGLWDSAALAEVRIPPGPRLLILAHIDQYRHILRPAMPVGKYLPHD